MAPKIEGLKRLQAKLDKLPLKVKQRIREAMEAGANEIVGMMQNMVPIGSTMALHDSIGWTWGRAPKGSFAIAKIKSADGGDLTITIYAGNKEAYYARWVEFGTAASNGSASRRDTRYKTRSVMTQAVGAHAGTPAQPFFYVIFRANRRRAKGRISRAITKAAKEVAASG